jgi:hypothetical protein
MTVFTLDVATGEVTEREQTPEELADNEAFGIEYEAQLAEREAKAEARKSALSKLAALGLTQEEIDAL